VEPEGLLDNIYEASVLPERWLHVLDDLAGIANSEGAYMFAAGPEGAEGVCSRAIEDMIKAFMSSPWASDNPRAKRLVPLREPRFLTDLDAIPLEEIEGHPFYKFLRNGGYGWCVGTAIHSPNADTLVFSIERTFAKGPVQPEEVAILDRLRPHLARSSLLAARLGLEKAKAKVTALETVGLPAAVLTRTGRVLAANALLEAHAPAITIGAFDLLHVAGGGDTLLRQTLARNSVGGTGCSIPIRSDGEKPASVIHVLPLRGQGRDLFSGASSLLYVTSMVRKDAPAAELLEALFDLTPAEAKVTRAVAEGHRVAEIAELQGVQINTIKTHLKSIFAKTGVNRQVDLVRLLSSGGPTDHRAG
jgi:DNA-binding CsgD family transcriptional regulator